MQSTETNERPSIRQTAKDAVDSWRTGSAEYERAKCRPGARELPGGVIELPTELPS